MTLRDGDDAVDAARLRAAGEEQLVSTCASCASQIATSIASTFGWAYWTVESGRRALLCPACATRRFGERPRDS